MVAFLWYCIALQTESKSMNASIHTGADAVYYCILDQLTLFLKIELFPSIILSRTKTNSNNDIPVFLQQFEWLRVNWDSNSHYNVLGVK